MPEEKRDAEIRELMSKSQDAYHQLEKNESFLTDALNGHNGCREFEITCRGGGDSIGKNTYRLQLPDEIAKDAIRLMRNFIYAHYEHILQESQLRLGELLRHNSGRTGV